LPKESNSICIWVVSWVTSLLFLFVVYSIRMDRVIYNRKKEFISNREQPKQGTLNTFLSNTFVKIGLIGISVFLLYSVYNSIVITGQKIEISKRARQEVDNLRLENLKLALALESMQTNEYLEVQARDRLNFAGESEFLFVIPESVLESAKERVNTYLYGVEDVEDIPSYLQWFEFVKNGI